MRVGHPDYAEENGSHGITTARKRHMRITPEGMEIRELRKSESLLLSILG